MCTLQGLTCVGQELELEDAREKDFFIVSGADFLYTRSSLNITPLVYTTTHEAWHHECPA